MANQSKFDKAVASIVRNLASEGKTQKEIAKMMDIHSRTFWNWLQTNTQLRAAMLQGKRGAIDYAEATLYKKAIGYFMTETKVFCDKGDIVTHEIEKFYPPDTNALIFYLKNARPEKWSDSPDPVDDDNRKIQLAWKPKSLRGVDDVPTVSETENETDDTEEQTETYDVRVKTETDVEVEDDFDDIIG